MFQQLKDNIAYACEHYPRLRNVYIAYHALVAFCCTGVSGLLIHYEWFWDAPMGGVTSVFNRIALVFCILVSVYCYYLLYLVYSWRKQLAR